MQEIFEENKSENFYGAIIWTPMVVTDSQDAASVRESIFSDFRVKQLWDPARICGQYLSRTLNLTSTPAWDVYLVYPPDHSWDQELPPAPKFWMHQLDEQKQSLFLEPTRLKQYVQTLIERTASQ
ncbi:MAG TPA: hypothetical protein VFC02_10310 [Anaerolineales bacterium]|nr:hypothetical protein [Anaerolineales bacterium]